MTEYFDLKNQKIRRAFFLDWTNKILHDRAFYPILIHNLIPIYGVLFLQWDTYILLSIYILETVIIGIFNIPKILLSQLPVNSRSGGSSEYSLWGKMGFVLFFLIHYMMFNFGQIELFLDNNSLHLSSFNFLLKLLTTNVNYQIAVASVIVSNLGAFLFNYIGKEQYKKMNPLTLVFLPYGRVMLQQFVGIFGSFLVVLFNLPILLLILLQTAKFLGEIISHYFFDEVIQFESN